MECLYLPKHLNLSIKQFKELHFEIFPNDVLEIDVHFRNTTNEYY